ncbi:MAG TPA: hypothetical protein PKG52_10540 [bacterium]|nr:hypothetical protein [bacterium]
MRSTACVSCGATLVLKSEIRRCERPVRQLVRWSFIENGSFAKIRFSALATGRN